LADRYDVSTLIEAQHEPGSRGRVLRNLLGITHKRQMNLLEAQAQVRALESGLGDYAPDHRFMANDVRHLHRTWLAGIYAWAGEYRQVNVSKAEMPSPQPLRFHD
jgi:cell filamentation protein